MEGGASNGPKQPRKCQRPRTEGARTSGAALLFSGRPSAGAMKHRRRRWKSNGDGRRVPHGAPVVWLQAYCGTSRTTGPRAAGGGGAVGCAADSTFWPGLGGFPIGPYKNAITSTTAATIAPKILANFSEFISISR